MRIVMVHNYYQTRGGEDESFESEARLLRAAGHDVVTVTEHNDQVEVIGHLRTAIRTVWSQDAHGRVREALRTAPTDILHVQNTFPLLSPSVYYAARAERVPVIQSLRNYRQLCVNGLLHRDGRVCEECLGRRMPWPGVKHACYRGQHDASAVVATMIGVHRIAGTWKREPDLYIALSNFAKEKFIAAGLPAERIVVKPNFVEPDPGVGAMGAGHAIFVGRLTVDKGVRTLLAAWASIGSRVPLQIVGDGPLSDEVRSAAATIPGVTYLGRRSVSEVHQLIKEARFLIFPSEWYEPFGRVVVEAFAAGKPVIGARIGAIDELVQEGVTGLLFQPGDPCSLAQRVTWAVDNPERIEVMGTSARQMYEAEYSPDRNYEQLMDAYMSAIANSKSRHRTGRLNRTSEPNTTVKETSQ